MAKSEKVTIRVGQFVYYREVPNNRNPGSTVLKADVAARGQEIEVNERDYERGTRLGAFVGSVDESTIAQAAVVGEPAGFSASEAGVDEIAAEIEEHKLSVDDTVALAGDDPNTAERVLEAERQLAKENDDDPRKGVVEGLSKVIGGN